MRNARKIRKNEKQVRQVLCDDCERLRKYILERSGPLER